MVGFFPKSVSGLLVAIMVANMALFAVVMQPKPAEAQFTDFAAFAQRIAQHVWNAAKFVYEKAVDLKNAAFQVWVQFKSNNGVIAEIVSTLLVTAMHIALGKLTNDIVAWINGGGKGQIRILQDPGKFLGDALDAAGGVLAGQLLGVDPRTLCNADWLKLKLTAVFAGPYAVPTFQEKFACTFSGMADGLRRFQQDFREGGWAAFIQYSERQNNPLGQAVLTSEELERVKAEKLAASTAELGIGGGFLAQKKCVITKGRAGSESSDSQFVGRDVEEVINGGTFRGYNIDEFINYWNSQGGVVQCKITTPAQQISELTNTALQAPIRNLENAINGLTTKLGTGAGSTLKPYVLAIANAAINQLLKKGRGLVAASFERPQKPRPATRQYTGSLQNNALLGNSAVALAGSVGDFRGFLLKTLIDFNIFISASANVIDASDKALGRTAIDEPNWDATSCPLPPATTDPATGLALDDPGEFVNTNSCYLDNRYGPAPGTLASDWPPGWPRQYGPGDPEQPYLAQYDPNNPARVRLASPSNIYMNTPGKTFREEAEWCGAYFQEIPLANENSSVTLASYLADPANSSIHYSATEGTIISTNPNINMFTCPANTYLVKAVQVSNGTNNGIVANYTETDIQLSPTSIVSPYSCRSASSGGNNGGENCQLTCLSFPFPSTIQKITTPPGGTASCPVDPVTGLRSYMVRAWNSRADNPPGSGMSGAEPDGAYQGNITANYVASSCTGIGSNSCSFTCITPNVGAEFNPTGTGTSTNEIFWEKYFSPTFEGGTVSLLNRRQGLELPTTSGGTLGISAPSSANNAVLVRGNFYPELTEKMQELMEKTRVIEGYHFDPTLYPTPTDKAKKDYLSPLADQLGTIPDDDPLDNDPKNPAYATYKGSVSDVLTRYNELNQTFQALFAGLQDENSLEGVDKDLKILTPEENNVRLALIGQRCPAIPPTATSSTPELLQKCPVLPNGQYNMARKFIFEPDRPNGITTGFATNPFTQEQSSAMAGFLNLEEMTTQLGSLPPNKNIIKLVRARQLLEQLQVAPRPFAVPGKPGVSLNPGPLTGVDIVQVSLSGYERIQDWLNNTTTSNLDIQALINAYGYTSATEAYPQISAELDDILEEAVNQITDKLKDVFLKRTELALEEARVNAQERLTRFVEYVRDLDSVVKLEMEPRRRNNASPPAEVFTDTSVRPLATALGHGSFLRQIAADAYVLGADSRALFDPNQTAVDNLLIGLNESEKRGLIGSAVYKIKTLAGFIGIDTTTLEFSNRISQYTTSAGTAADLDARVRAVLRDVYIYYTGIKNLEDGAGDITRGSCVPATLNSAARCTLNTGNALYKDARMKLGELSNDLGLMLDEVDGIKQEFQDLIADTQQNKQALEDMLKLLQGILADYDRANACFGFPTTDESLWRLPASARRNYSVSGPGLYGSLVAVATAGAALSAGFSLAAAGPLGALAGFAVSAFINRRKAKKARAAAERARQQALQGCAQGIDDFNRKLGQLADNFVCGKINKKYEDR